MGAGLLCAFGGVLLLLFPNYVPMLIVIRLTAGIGHSLAFITGLLHGSENCHKDHRTALVSKFPLRMLAGAVWSSSMISTEDYADDTGIMDVNQLTALAVTLVSLAAALPAPFFTYPSLIDLVRRRDYDQVKHIMQRLRHESTETPEIRSDFEELQKLVDEDAKYTTSIVADGNVVPLLKVLLMRIATVCGANYAMNMTAVEMLAPVLAANYSPWVVVVCRAVGVLIGARLAATKVEAKYLLAHSALQCGLMALVCGCGDLLRTASEILQAMSVLGLSLFAGCGLLFVPDLMLAEAFPLPKKLASVVAVMICEFALHITIITVTYSRNVTEYGMTAFYTFQLILFGSSVAFYLLLPNTRGLSLRETKNAFLSKSRSLAVT